MFQQQVYITPARAVAGDFASENPTFYAISPTGLMVADTNGVKVGKFAVLNDDGTVSSTLGSGSPRADQLIFVHRENNAQITTYLAESGYTIQPGQPVAGFIRGDFWVNADAITGTPTKGAQVWFDASNGNTIIGAPGTPTAAQSNTGYVLLSTSATVNATVAIGKIPA
ncbi:hypothetical protein T2_00025 [Ralstonia phage Elie]|uniref:Uncharacterized protein n=4 Tax=Bakolyvirus TaxID=2843355 RepID=A0A7G5BBQ4_9CAUD|nr:minor head protein [Ralstonia phage Adzire]YP_010052782.1 minor head protein [Ralstonia phage Bakoly]YP_010077712.1 minor head protein [Ralstonia phage Simangalove]QMV32970.1 hypothetical protein T2_00025 [Ralstonia phage Elie]QMV33537.1 hypothetical protein 30B_00030 [Ralstonia phage Jenny]QMV33682.1 hypothetical protein S3_00038 [Ralstonia phage Sarlave]QMV32342.1 hypothetical protein S1_00025 [Ralstonia phage Adzire]QMV32606.1 hypothetical protein 2B_00033 [Ralstonia phage Bakoly]